MFWTEHGAFPHPAVFYPGQDAVTPHTRPADKNVPLKTLSMSKVAMSNVATVATCSWSIVVIVLQ